MPPPPAERPLWPYCTAGALLLLTALVVPQIGAYEGGDVVVVLGPLAVVLGALLGGLVGAAVHRLTR